MKSLGTILILLFSTLFTFSALAQTVEVKAIIFLDANGDCQKQSNEIELKSYYSLWYDIKNGVGNSALNYSSMQDTLKINLNKSSNYSIKIRGIDSISHVLVNCSNSDSFYPFSVGLNDTLIYIPLKDTICSIRTYKDLKLFTFCKNDSADFHYSCIKFSGAIKAIVNWGDGTKDTFIESQPSIEFRVEKMYLYSTAGLKTITIETYNKVWGLIKIDTMTCTVENCREIKGKLYTDTNSNCLYNNEPVLNSKSIILRNKAFNWAMTTVSDNLGNFIFNVKDGDYLLLPELGILNCKDTNISNKDYLKITVNGSNIIKDIPMKDSFYLNKVYMESIKRYLCDGDTLMLSTNIVASSIYHTVLAYGNGKRDTFLNNLPNTIKYKYQSSSNGVKKIIAFIYTSNWILKDSVWDTVVLNICNKKLKGKVYVDYNPNCGYNGSTDPIVPNYRIIMKDSNDLIRKIVFTDVNGDYSFDYDTNLAIKVYVNDFIACNGGKKFYSIASNSPANGVKDFPISRDSIDVSIYLVRRGIIFPGDSLKLSLMHNSLVPFSFMSNYRSYIPNKSSVSRANNANSFSLTASNAYVQYATNSISNYLVYNFSTATQSTDTFCFNARLAKVNNELDTTNNETTWCMVARNSYDPNDKQVAIRSIQKNGDFTDRNDALVYTVRFQNTGTAPARNIYILDSLTHKLDLNTFQFLTSSHPASLSLDENRMFRIDFKNINLPDSASNPQGSQGYFIYSIKPKSNLDTGELIENVANIFFDFNPPITTNTTKNRFVRKSKNDFDWTSGVKDNNSSEKLFIYPNPVQISLNFNTSDKKEFRIRNSLGVLVLEGECEEKIDLAILSKGIYIIEIQTKNQSSHFKFLKE